MSVHYPPGPRDVPADFTEPSSRYETQVLLVLGSLFFTLLLYLALVALCGWGLYELIVLPWPRRVEMGHLLVRSLGLFCCGCMFLYLVKGLFKTQGGQRDDMIEITEAEQPDLFAFVRQLCADTGAPMPRRIFVSHEVNACVFYPSSLLSLIMPGRKSLLIGLGLVQALNLTELKTVLAHELGHFSQSSMALGSYVYVANRVLADIVYGRDFLDRSLSEMKSWDPRVAFFANIFAVLLGYLRLLFELIFKGINLLSLSLSRQMEFNADRFSVKVAGSDAVGQTLQRSVYADEVFAQLQSELWAAGDHQLYSNDIFAHFDGASAALGRHKKDPNWSARPSAIGPDEFLFQTDAQNDAPDMWSTHPGNFERERHAKEVYLAADTDTRPAWLLFRQPEALREAVSRRFYEVIHHPKVPLTLTDAARVQEFLNEEYAETTYDEKYAGFYDNRYLELNDLHCLPTRANYVNADDAIGDIEAIQASMFDWAPTHRRRQEESERLGNLLGKQNPHADGACDLEHQFKKLQEELESDRKVQTDGDARLYLAHQFLAKEIGCAAEYEQRYQFHIHIQDLHQKVTDAIDIANEVLDDADASGGEMSEGAFGRTVGGLREAVSRFNEVAMSSSRFRIPKLKHISDGPFLNVFLGMNDFVHDLNAHGGCIEGAWIEDLLDRLAEVEDKLRRLHFKSLGGILALQESVVQRWRAKPIAAMPQVAAKRPWH
jgi:Zn-dependent protease with chaperone function